MTARDVWGTAYLLVPLLGGGILHALCMRYDWLAFLKRPIDGGVTFRGARLFGANKTFRGPVAVGLGAAAVLGVQTSVLHRIAAFRRLELFDYGTVDGWLLGFAVGAGAMLAELPNSLVKRQLGVAPGRAAPGVAGAVLWVLDQIDLLLGAWLVLATVTSVRLVWVLVSIGVVVLVHQALTTVTFALGMRGSPR